MDFVNKMMNDDDNSMPQHRSPRSSNRNKSKSQNPGNKEKSNEDINLLRKEIEEMKFYQELEQTEYQEMKDKMHNYEKKIRTMEQNKEKDMKRIVSEAKRSSSRKKARPLIESDDDESAFESEVKPSRNRGGAGDRKLEKALQKKLKSKQAQLEQLQEDLEKTKADLEKSKADVQAEEKTTKEYEKKVEEMEKAMEQAIGGVEKSKEQDITAIRDHYGNMMETVAKQLQKANKRHDDETAKNSKLRSIMEEMRSDMTRREKDLEKKLKAAQNNLKKSEMKMSRIESKMEKKESKFTSTRNELEETSKSHQEYMQKVNTLERRLEEETKELVSDHEEKIRRMEREYEEETENLQKSVDEEISELTAEIANVEGLYNDEREEHTRTSEKLGEVETALRESEAKIQALQEQIEKDEMKRDDGREEFLQEIDDLQDELKEQRDEYEQKIMDMAKERLAAANELKIVSAELVTAQNHVRLLNDDKTKKSTTIKKRGSELEVLQEKLDSINGEHMKVVKNRDIEFVRAKKKWSMSEQQLKDELDDLRAQFLARPVKIVEKVTTAPPGSEDTGGDKILRKMVDQLKAEKASLQMNIASIEGKANTELKLLEKELANHRRFNATTPYDRKLKEKIDSTRDPEPEEEEEAVSPIESPRDITTVSDTDSVDSPTIPVESPKIKKKKASSGSVSNSNSYRNYVRQRKFSKKKVVE